MGGEVKCGFCHTSEESESICGTLHKDTYEGKMIAAHYKCMQYSAMLVQYNTDDFGGFKKKEVVKEIKRGNRLACHLCKVGKNRKKSETKGATSGCALASCRKTFHYYCVSMNPKTVTKRYKVSASNKEVFLYRVFCSKLHEQLYKSNITSEDIEGQGQSSGDENEDNNDKQDESEKSSSDSDEEFQPAGRKHTGTPTENEPKRLRSRANDEVNETPSNIYRLSSPEMTADEVVVKTQRLYQQVLQKRKARERASSSKANDTNGENSAELGISIDTDSGENVTEDCNTSNDPSPDNTDLSETESMLNSSHQGQYILIPSKLDVDFKTVCKEAKLAPESVLLWPSSERGLKDKYMLFVMWDIANKIGEGDQTSLVKLLSDPACYYYEPFCSFLSGRETNITDDLEQIIDEVNIKYNNEVFRMLKISIGEVDLSILILNIPGELLDGYDLATNFSVCQWTTKTVLSFSCDRISDFPLEKQLLLKWLTCHLGQKYELFVHVKEGSVKSHITGQSIGRAVISRLKSASQNLFSDCPLKVFVIYDVDRSVFKFKPYVQYLVESFVSRHPGFECFCVIDILPEDEIREISDVVSPGLLQMSVQVYSSVCPTYHQVSCVVVHVDRDIRYAGRRGGRAAAGRSRMPAVYLDVDEEHAST